MYKLKRMWINQPSTLQANHKWHGKNVLAEPPDDLGFARIWFTDGNPDSTISTEIRTNCLSEGWKAKPQQFEINSDDAAKHLQTARKRGFKYAIIAEDGSASCCKNLLEFAQFCNHYDISGCSFWELF